MDLPPLRPTAIQASPRIAGSTADAFVAGQVFAAEVLQASDGSSVVLGVGRERIAATSQAALQVGQRLWLRVRGSGASKTFEILGQIAPEVPESLPSLPMLRGDPRTHPFGLLAQGKGAGQLLTDLALALSSRGESTPAQARELQRALSGLAFPPGADGTLLAQAIERTGLGHEARALGRALDAVPTSVLARLAEELWSAALQTPVADEESAPLRLELRAQLARFLAEPGALARWLEAKAPAGGAAVPPSFALLRWLEEALGSVLPAGTSPSRREELAQTLRFARLSPRLAQAMLEALLGDQASLVRELAGAPAQREQAAAPDLKQLLASALEGLETGPERTAVRAALDALEAEQLVALARSSVGDGSSWLLALREGAGFADARLLHLRPEEHGSGPDGTRERGAERAVLGMEFSRTGPVRAEFALERDALRVRLCVSREDVAARLNATLAELCERLEAGGRSVQVHVSLRDAEDLRVPGPESDRHLDDGRGAVNRLA